MKHFIQQTPYQHSEDFKYVINHTQLHEIFDDMEIDVAEQSTWHGDIYSDPIYGKCQAVYHEIDDQAICDDLGVQELVCLWNKAINPKRPVAYGLLDWQYIRNR